MSPGVPPHPRGSTRFACLRRFHALGSPAPAGIDPYRCDMTMAFKRLPRTRGDRPRAGSLTSSRNWAPPHPRGSTPGEGAEHVFAAGSPAPAGIDPLCVPATLSCARLPRTRGDRPVIRFVAPLICGAPPHPRVIDPPESACGRLHRRLPRTRGDRPSDRSHSRRNTAASPHPRGSTRPRRRRVGALRGSPAPAGIDPDDGCEEPTIAGLPRTRGDRP